MFVKCNKTCRTGHSNCKKKPYCAGNMELLKQKANLKDICPWIIFYTFVFSLADSLASIVMLPCLLLYHLWGL